MNGGSRIIAIGGGQDKPDGPDQSGVGQSIGAPIIATGAGHDDDGRVHDDSGSVDPAKPGWSRGWRTRLVAIVAIIGWTWLFLAANQREIIGHPTLADLANMITAWSMPVAMVLAVVLVRRTSWRDPVQLRATSAALASEAALLERRMTSMTNELSLAREFITAQSRDLEALGRIAVDRLSGGASRLQDLIAANGSEVERIGAVSNNALDNFEKLRGQLPVIANSARDVTNSIAQAGHAAHGQVEDLVGAFRRLNELGLSSEQQVGRLRDRVDDSLATFADVATRIGAVGEERLATITAAIKTQRIQLDDEEQAALDAIRARAEALAHELADQRQVLASAEEESIAALGARFAALGEDGGRVAADLARAIEEVGRDHDGLLAVARERLATFEANATLLNRRLLAEAGLVAAGLNERRAEVEATLATAHSELAERLAEIDKAIDARRDRHAAGTENLARTCDRLGERIAAFGALLDKGNEQSAETTRTVDAGLERLSGRLEEMRTRLAGTDREIAALTDGAVRLLELIQAGSEHSRSQLPEALRSAEAGLAQIETRVVGLRDTLREAGNGGSVLAQRVGATRNDLGEAVAEAARLNEALLARGAEQDARLAGLREQFGAVRSDSEALSHEIETRLSGAVAKLSEAALAAGASLESGAAGEIERLAARLGSDTSAAIAGVLEGVMDGKGRELIAGIEHSIENTARASRDTMRQLQDQLARVEDLARNLEQRVERARSAAEEQIDNDFARRAAVINDSLHSTSVDIARVLAGEISDTAWAAYLRGDRGIFTRRAVSLLDAAEVRAVQQHYEADAAFRAHVNRYVHDFEAMLRQLLSTRDGHALGVTLLSSDIGKLYVALAQGIERLRT